MKSEEHGKLKKSLLRQRVKLEKQGSAGANSSFISFGGNGRNSPNPLKLTN
jgi:hypothetical protein